MLSKPYNLQQTKDKMMSMPKYETEQLDKHFQTRLEDIPSNAPNLQISTP